MNGYLVLEGGAEFGGKMRLPDLKAIELAGGSEAAIRIIPTAAAPDHNDTRAAQNGVRWFKQLGANNVDTVKLTDKMSANSFDNAKILRDAKLIYMLGGFTHYLAQTLHGSKSWEAVLNAYQNGAVVAGSSAGAMVMCEFYFDPSNGKVLEGLNLIQNTIVLPHYNTFGKGWAARISEILPDVTLLGIDERTGMVDSGDGKQWSVLGEGSVTIYYSGKQETHSTGSNFLL